MWIYRWIELLFVVSAVRGQSCNCPKLGAIACIQACYAARRNQVAPAPKQADNDAEVKPSSDAELVKKCENFADGCVAISNRISGAGVDITQCINRDAALWKKCKDMPGILQGPALRYIKKILALFS